MPAAKMTFDLSLHMWGMCQVSWETMWKVKSDFFVITEKHGREAADIEKVFFWFFTKF